jgi:HK97 family phage major capsid protein
MASQLTKLQDRAAAVAAMLDELSKVEERSAEQAAEYERLAGEAEGLEKELAREHAIAEKITALRGRVAATAKPVEVAAVSAPSVESARPLSGRAAKHFRSSSDAEACGRWIRGYVLGRAEDRNWYEKNVESRALSPNDNNKGGSFVPDTFASTVIRLVESYGAFPSQANNLTMTSDTLYVPRRTGGNTAYHTAANAETTVTDMATDNVMLSSKEVRVGTRVPNQLIDDSAIDLASLVAEEFALAIALRIDTDGFVGTGVSANGGIRGIQTLFETQSNLTTAANIFNSAQTAVASLTVDDFMSAIAKAPTYAIQSPTAGWYCTPQMHALAMQSLALGGSGALATEVVDGVRRPSFLGYPVYFNNVMRATASTDQVVALFGDMKKSSHFALRRQVAVRASTERYIEFDQTYLQGTVSYDCVSPDIGDASVNGPVVALIL